MPSFGLWIYAVYAVVIDSRAAADRRGTTVEQVARDLMTRHGHVDDVERLDAKERVAAQNRERR